MLIQIAYTNTNCSDLWEMFIGENKEHCDIPLCIIADDVLVDDRVKSSFLYDNSEPYYRVWSDAIKMFASDYFIYLQEDFILYDDVEDWDIYRCVDFLKDNKEYSFVRLLRATSFGQKEVGERLYEVESTNKNVFAMQPTIWRSVDYLKLLDATKEYRWLETPKYHKEIRRMNMKGAYHYSGESKAGKHHYDSFIYPYVATALVKGKWNVSEYGDVLGPLFQKYGIDPGIRGTI